MKAGLPGLLLVLLATDASAHRLDEYLQATRVSVATDRVDLSIDLTPGAAIADQLWVVIDEDRDGRVSDTEIAAYAGRVLEDTRISLDEDVLALRLLDASCPTLHEITSGLGVIRIRATAPVGPLRDGSHALSLTHAHLPLISVYQANALVPKDPAVRITKQTRDELQQDYRLEFQVGPGALPRDARDSEARARPRAPG